MDGSFNLEMRSDLPLGAGSDGVTFHFRFADVQCRGDPGREPRQGHNVGDACGDRADILAARSLVTGKRERRVPFWKNMGAMLSATLIPVAVLTTRAAFGLHPAA
jgi:hypothetical protein